MASGPRCRRRGARPCQGRGGVMSDFVEQCRSEWRRLGVPDPLAEEMATDLASDLSDAEAEGVPPRSTSGAVSSIRVRSRPPGRPSEGSSPHRPAGERPPQTARPRGVHRPRSDRTDRYGAAAPDRGAQGLSRRDRTADLTSRAATGLLRTTRREPASPPHKRIRPGRVDPAVLRARRARLRCLAVVEVGPLATTHCPRLGAANSYRLYEENRHVCAQSPGNAADTERRRSKCS